MRAGWKDMYLIIKVAIAERSIMQRTPRGLSKSMMTAKFCASGGPSSRIQHTLTPFPTNASMRKHVEDLISTWHRRGRGLGHHGAVSLFRASCIYVGTPLVVQEGMTALAVAIMFLEIISGSIGAGRGIILQAGLCIMTIHGMIDRVLALQARPETGKEIQSFVACEIATEMVRLHLPCSVVAIAGTRIVEHMPFTIAGSFCVCDKCEI